MTINTDGIMLADHDRDAVSIGMPIDIIGVPVWTIGRAKHYDCPG